MTPLTVGLVGCGDISTAYLALAPRYRPFRITALADQLPEAAQRQAAATGLPAMEVEAMLGSDVDIVLNLTPPAAHAALTRRALAAGKHVYSEKPFVLTAADGRELISLADAAGLRLGSAPDTFLGPAHQCARQVVETGAIGRIVTGTAAVMGPGMESWHPNPDFFFQPGGGPVLDMGPYYLTALVDLLGPVASVTALGTRGQSSRRIGSGTRTGESVPVNTPTTIHALIAFETGPPITFSASWDVHRHSLPLMELYGTGGSLQLADPNHFAGPVAQAGRSGAFTALEIPDHPFGAITLDGQANHRGAGLAEMALAIAEGRPHRCAAGFALHVVEVLTAILRAAQTGSPQVIASRPERPAALPVKEAARLIV